KGDRQGLAQTAKHAHRFRRLAFRYVTTNQPLIELFGQIIRVQPSQVPRDRTVPVALRLQSAPDLAQVMDEFPAQPLSNRHSPRNTQIARKKAAAVEFESAHFACVVSSFEHLFERAYIGPN